MSGTKTSYKYPLFALVILGMVVAMVAGWQLAGRPVPEPGDRQRVAVLPFMDPDTGENSSFNRALTAAFDRALKLADPEHLAVVGPDTTARMMGAGLSPAEVAQRADADFLLMGGHRESDHGTFVELWPAAGDESLLRRDFELDETRPAHAPPELVEAIRLAITEATNR
jgi:hypothetical protein